ncbi:MAG: hypothetical protein HC773_21650, partial [Scytonema sp. CRU_2_7]|nr:hypothetical protein [Scytonema sp. CRU_2_7]
MNISSNAIFARTNQTVQNSHFFPAVRLFWDNLSDFYSSAFLLFAFYAPFESAEYVRAGVKDSGIAATFPFAGGDQVFPNFITKNMPSGLSGLVIAAIFAAALSSSLNSIAATATNDLYKPFAKDKSDKH